MTDHDSAVTAAELERWINERCTHWHSSGDADLTEYGKGAIKSARETRDVVLPVLASLRKQLDEARRERDELNRSIFGLYDTCAKYRADNAKKDAALREARDELTYHPTRKPSIIGVIDAALTPASQETPGHTDLMVAPESIDAFLEANPLPEEAPASPKDVHIEHTLAASPSPGLRECTCHPDDNPPNPCAQKFAYSECVGLWNRDGVPCCNNPAPNLCEPECAGPSRPVSEREGE